MISAVFRRGGDVSFVVEELKDVFDPRGGHWVGGRYVPSLLAAIGEVIERHMIDIGFIQRGGRCAGWRADANRRGRERHARNHRESVLSAMQPSDADAARGLSGVPRVWLFELQLKRFLKSGNRFSDENTCQIRLLSRLVSPVRTKIALIAGLAKHAAPEIIGREDQGDRDKMMRSGSATQIRITELNTIRPSSPKGDDLVGQRHCSPFLVSSRSCAVVRLLRSAFFPRPFQAIAYRSGQRGHMLARASSRCATAARRHLAVPQAARPAAGRRHRAAAG